MKYTNSFGLPESFVNAVKTDTYYDEERGDISCTTLIKPPQIRVLENLHFDDIIEDVSDKLWALFGQLGHAILERQTVKSSIVEERLFHKVLGWLLSGKYDNQTLIPERILQDYKFTSVFAVKDIKSEWEEQLNILRFLAHHNGYTDIERLQIVAMLRDWNKFMKLQQGDSYPDINVKVIDVPMWELDKTGDFISDRVKLHQAADAGDVPPCTDSERWASNLCFQVMKKGNVRATKSFTTEFSSDPKKEAEGFIQDKKDTCHKDANLYDIIEKPREFKRCDSYCSVAPFCPQYQGENK